MKKTALLIFVLFVTLLSHAAVTKSLTGMTAGGLKAALSAQELTTVTNLTVTGVIDARDFKTMRDDMTVLAVIDLSGTTVAEYIGTEGTDGIKSSTYGANAIPTNAFSWQATPLTRFTSIALPSDVKIIKIGVFANCKGLSGKLVIPATVEIIEYSAYFGCSGFTSLAIPSSVTSIQEAAFQVCSGLKGDLIIPNSVTEIRMYAFSSCSGLESVTIPSSVTTVGANAFQNCSGLTSIKLLSETPINLTSSIDVFLGVNKTTCKLYVPFGTKALYAAANQWKDFTSIIEMPKTVSCVAGGLKAALTALERNTLTSLVVTGTIDARDFKTMRDNMPALVDIDLSGTTVIGYTGTEGTYPSFDNTTYSANAIPKYAFYNQYTYSGKYSLKTFTYPSLVTTIEDVAFNGCSGLIGSFAIPSSITTIGSQAFAGCIGFTGSLTIQSSVTIIGYGAFWGCNGFTSLNVPTTGVVISGAAFSHCTGLSGTLSIPESITTIPSSCFEFCSGLNGSLIIPNYVTIIESYAFRVCTGLTSLIIPKSVTRIEWSAFSDCENLTSIYANAATPIDLKNYTNIFYNVNKTTCILHVPQGSKGLYENANQWEDFFNIVDDIVATPLERTQDSETISIYPNPTTEGFKISGIEGSASLTLTDVNGKLVLAKEVRADEFVSVSSLPSGVYIARVISGGGMKVEKIVKK